MRLIKLITASLLLIAGTFAILWFIISQPFVSYSKQAREIAVSEERLLEHVRTLSVELPPRNEDTDNLDVTASYIRRQFESIGDVNEDEYTVWGIPYRNISVVVGPATPERVVIGAHYDSFDGLPGADDNASGVAGLIELAMLLRDVPLDRSVELIAYTLEEPPYFRTQDMGSAIHAKRLSEEGAEVVLMVSLEMIGYYSDAPGSQAYPMAALSYMYPDTGNFIAVVGDLSGFTAVRRVKAAMKGVMDMPVHSINAPSFIPGIDFSDHLNFWRHGYPAVMITDTAFYRNSAYHTDRDTWDRLDYSRMAQVVKGVFATVLEFAGDGSKASPAKDEGRSDH